MLANISIGILQNGLHNVGFDKCPVLGLTILS
jgi:hypothetical protein